jgi:hypothetical protein
VRDLIEFDVSESARIRVISVPAVGQQAIFSENWLLNRAAIEVSATMSSTALEVSGLITINSFAHSPMVFRIDSIGDYVAGDGTTYPITVYYTTRTA